MSLPIKQTPVLKGKDALRFIRRMRENETRPISERERADYRRARELYDRLKEKGWDI